MSQIHTNVMDFKTYVLYQLELRHMWKPEYEFNPELALNDLIEYELDLAEYNRTQPLEPYDGKEDF